MAEPVGGVVEMKLHFATGSNIQIMVTTVGEVASLQIDSGNNKHYIRLESTLIIFRFISMDQKAA